MRVSCPGSPSSSREITRNPAGIGSPPALDDRDEAGGPIVALDLYTCSNEQVDPHAELNTAQRAAVDRATDRALLIVAGAGTGKTTTLAHRIVRLILDGADPHRILLLTFSRRAAQEMIRCAQRVVARGTDLPWAGTFHAVGSRILRLHGAALGLDPSFTVLDRGDAADLIDLVRADHKLATGDRRFPRKDTCLAIYSRVVNARRLLD